MIKKVMRWLYFQLFITDILSTGKHSDLLGKFWKCVIFLCTLAVYFLKIMKNFSRELDDLRHEVFDNSERVEKLFQENQTIDECHENTIRRRLYSALEILRIDVIEARENGTLVEAEVANIESQIDLLLPLLKIRPIQRKFRWWTTLEFALRFAGMVSAFMLAGTLLSLPIIAARAIEDAVEMLFPAYAARKDPLRSLSESFKRFVVLSMLYQSGIRVAKEGFDDEYFCRYHSTLLCFSHASSLDGFFVSGLCPIKQLAFGKKELFLMPFFSWLSLAIGGIPVDRNNRDRAISALRMSIDAAGVNAAHSGDPTNCKLGRKLCIAIAPEGTRSTSGNLLPFKKGTLPRCLLLRSEAN